MLGHCRCDCIGSGWLSGDSVECLGVIFCCCGMAPASNRASCLAVQAVSLGCVIKDAASRQIYDMCAQDAVVLCSRWRRPLPQTVVYSEQVHWNTCQQRVGNGMLHMSLCSL